MKLTECPQCGWPAVFDLDDPKTCPQCGKFMSAVPFDVPNGQAPGPSPRFSSRVVDPRQQGPDPNRRATPQ